MTAATHPDWCVGGEADPAATVHNGREAHAGKWRVSLLQIDTGTPLVHLGHPDLVEEHGQMEPTEALALGIALINQAAAALSRHTVPHTPDATRTDNPDPTNAGAR